MIIDQLFEDDKKKKLNEVDPRNFDSDEDYYAAVRGKRSSSDDDYDYEPEDDIDDMDDDESYYEKYVRTKNLEGYETTPFGSVNDQRPQMPAVPQQDREAQEQARERQARISDFREKKRDLLQQFAQLGTLRTEMIHGLDNDVFLNKDQLIDFFEQQIDDPSLTALEYAYENNIPTDGLIRNILRRATQLGVSMLDVRKMFNQAKQKLGENIGRKVDAKGLTQGEWMQAVKQKFPDAKIVQAKMIDGPAHALLSDGRKIVWNPVQGVAEGYDTAEDYRAKAEWLRRELHLSPDEAWERAYDTDPDSWVGTPWEHDYKQGVAEVGQNFRRGNARRAALNAMSPEELKAHEEKRAEQQRKRDETRLERERQRNAAKKGVAEGLNEMDKSQKGAPGWNISDDEPGGKESYGKAAKAKDVAKKAGKALDKAFDKAHSKKKVKESRLNEAVLLEDPVYRKFKNIGRYIAERRMSEKEILQVFADAEAGMTDKATGANRTFLGRGKDTAMDFAGGVADALKGVWSGIQSSVPVAAVDVAYDQATDALANLTGGQKGMVMQAIKKYRMLAKQYPKTAGLAKGALVALTGLATGGAGLPAAAAFIYGLDSAIKGEKLSDIALKAGGAAATAWAGQKIASAFGGDAAGAEAGGMGDPSQLPPFDDAGNLAPGFHISNETGLPYYTGELAPTPADIAAGYGPGGAGSGADSVAGLADTGAAGFGGGTYTTMPGDQGGFIAQANGVPFKDLEALNPQITNWNKLPPGTELQLPPSGPNTGSVWQGSTGAGGGATPPGPELLGGPGAGDVASPVADVAASAAVPAPSPFNLQPPATPGGPQFGTVTLPDGQTLKASVFPETSTIQPRLPMGSTPVTINYNGQELTGRIVNDTVYFTKFPGEAAAGSTTSGAGTLSGVTAQQIYDNPVYQQVYADQMAKFGSLPGAAARASQAAALAAKASMAGAVRESRIIRMVESGIKFKTLPVNKLVDEKSTVLTWALNESVGRKSSTLHLTPLGVITVFENVERWRSAIMELKGVPGSTRPDYYRPDMAGAPDPTKPPKKQSWFGKGLDYLDKGMKKVGGALSNFGHQFTTNVTKEKLKMNWHQAGKPSDSDALSAWLVKQGVPIGVVNSVYQKMGLPVSAEPVAGGTAAGGGAQTPAGGKAQRELPFYGTNPKTGKPWTVDQLQARQKEKVDAAVASIPPGPGAPVDPNATPAPPAMSTGGAGAFGNMASQLASRPTTSSTGGTTTGVSGVGGGVVRHTASATNPNQPKPATPAATPAATTAPVPTGTATLPAGGGAGVTAANPFGAMASSLSGGEPAAAPKMRGASRIPKKAPVAETAQAQRIAKALVKPVKEMLQLVETKDDVIQIKQFIDQTFVRYGAVNESAYAVRNTLIEHVTKIGAQRRRDFARKS